MKNENYWDGFIFGLFLGGALGIFILVLVQKGIN